MTEPENTEPEVEAEEAEAAEPETMGADEAPSNEVTLDPDAAEAPNIGHPE